MRYLKLTRSDGGVSRSIVIDDSIADKSVAASWNSAHAEKRPNDPLAGVTIVSAEEITEAEYAALGEAIRS